MAREANKAETKKPGRGRGRNVRITDVAEAAGVAPMTVSRVLNDPERVSPETARRVRAAIKSMGYVPNLLAGGLSSRRSRMVAAMVPTIASPIFSAPIQGFTDRLAQAGYHVMLSLTGYRGDAEEAMLPAVLSRRPDALLLTGARHGPAARRMLAAAGIPVVEIWDVGPALDSLVGFDHEEVGREVAKFFLAAGHTRFAALAASDPRAEARATGFLREAAAGGGETIETRRLPAPSSITEGRQALREIAPQLHGRTALFCSSDLVALGAATEARTLGIHVPEALAICGFGDFDAGRAAEPPITTVSVDGNAIGRQAAELLLARMAGAAAGPGVRVPFRILPRGST
jgi:LacI family gluconate utilization system Gnt-I transcriptional repressor